MTEESDALITSVLMIVAGLLVAGILFGLIRFCFAQCPTYVNPSVRNRINAVAIIIGAAPAALFLLIAYSLLLHAWIGSGSWPRFNGDEPRTLAFRIHALFAPGSLLALPLELALLVWSAMGVAKRGGSPAALLLTFFFSIGALWLIITTDPGNVFAWYFD